MTKTITTQRTPVAPSADAVTDLDAPRPLTGADLEVSTSLTRQDVLGTPTLEPPDSAAGQTAVAIGAWQTDKRVGAVWCNRSPRNAYMHVTGIGWKKLSPANDASWNAMVVMATQARQTGCRIDYRDEADGLVHEVYLW